MAGNTSTHHFQQGTHRRFDFVGIRRVTDNNTELAGCPVHHRTDNPPSKVSC
jgi:hypothetical protein